MNNTKTNAPKKAKVVKSKTLLKIMKYVSKYWYFIIPILLCAAAEVFASLATVLLIGNAIDALTNAQKGLQSLGLSCIVIAVLIALYLITEWLMEVFSAKLTHNVVRDIRRDAFNRIEEVPLKYIDGNRTGDLLSRIVVDVDQISDGLLMAATQLFSGIFTILATIVIMMVINYKIGLVVVVITPLSLVTAAFISKGTHKYFKRQSEIRGNVTSEVEEGANSAALYKIFGFSPRGEERFEKTNAELEKCSIKAVFFSSLPNPTTRFINNVIYILIGLFGSLAVISGAGGIFAVGKAFTVGALTSFLTYALKYAKPFNEITDVITEVQSALASAERVFALSNAEKELPDAPDAVVLQDITGEVDLLNVSFSYDKNVKLIENLNLHVGAGQNIAIVGRTGCGKTTLINLLMRFYDVDGGKIAVSGNNINDVTRNSLRSSYGMVLQDSYVFSGTVRKNIAFGRENATDEEIIKAAQNAHAYSFIKRLPNGLDTEIGENSNLSEGQKQLICIARAMLDLPQMLILDEATSSVDTRTEIKIQRAFDEMMKERTCFVVAHRLSTIKKADCIIVMDKGRVIERGTHEELLNKGGFYTELYNSQFARS